jgi:hypothetical protein
VSRARRCCLILTFCQHHPQEQSPMLPHPILDNPRIELDYPQDTSVRRVESPRFLPRRLYVTAARDLITNPLTIDEFRRRPFLNRSRWLLRAWDSDVQDWRQFYLGSSAQYYSPGTLQLAIYEPESTRPERLISRLYQPTIDDRRCLVRLIQHIEREGAIDSRTLRVIAPDMRLR